MQVIDADGKVLRRYGGYDSPGQPMAVPATEF
jgi:hypothetical protein